MPRERFLKQSLGQAQRFLPEAKVLVVGAGGIGCELLKNLVLTGFGDIHIIDLDTVDLSNLNRQFLFRQEHIKKPKALVAKEAAQKFNPNVKITAYHANIKDPKFNVEWLSSFKLALNALDNVDARRHVNKMCLMADVPLIDSGTQGFQGHVQVIKKGLSACFDCTSRPTSKSYPVCTIRSTPTQPIHCIVWAKSYLLQELFGENEDVIPELDTSEDSDNAQEIAKLKEEAEALNKIRESMGSDDFAKQVFDKVFKADIERLAGMEDMWQDRNQPEPLSYDTLAAESTKVDPSIADADQNVWSTAENFVVFRDSLSRLAKRLAEEQTNALQKNLPTPTIAFDKDDDDTLDFVTATANLRAQIFGIEPKSKFDTKQMAGNIIPAIATTNAMIAGLCVLQAFKVLRGMYERTKIGFVDKGTLTSSTLDPPNPRCLVCNAAMARLKVDAGKATLQDLVQGVLKLKLNYGDELSIMSEDGLLYDPDLEDNLEKKFSALGIADASFVIVKDDSEGETPRVDLHLAVELSTAEGESTAPAVQLVLKDVETLQIPRKPTKQLEELKMNGDAVEESAHQNGSLKRKRENEVVDVDEVDNTPAKRLKGRDGQIDVKGKGKEKEVDVINAEENDGSIIIE